MQFFGERPVLKQTSSELKPPPSQPANGIPIIFTISRMNPPTPGHLELIRELIEKALEVNAPNVYVILSKTVNNSDNPIECPSKIPVLQAMVASLKETMQQYYPDFQQQQQINDIQVVFECVSDNQKSPIAPLYDIVYEYTNNEQIPEVNLFMIVGDDRADFLDTIVDCMFFKIPKVHSVNGKILERDEMETYKNLDETQLRALDISTMPTSAFSASVVRKLVQFTLKEQFTAVYSPYLEEGAINRLYDEIRRGLTKQVTNTQSAKKKPSPKSEKVKQQKYQYPMVKEKINPNDSILQKRPATEISNCDCDDDENDCSINQKTKKGGRKKPTSTKKYRKHKKNTRKNTRKSTRKSTRKYSRKLH